MTVGLEFLSVYIHQSLWPTPKYVMLGDRDGLLLFEATVRTKWSGDVLNSVVSKEVPELAAGWTLVAESLSGWSVSVNSFSCSFLVRFLFLPAWTMRCHSRITTICCCCSVFLCYSSVTSLQLERMNLESHFPVSTSTFLLCRLP